MSHRTTSHHSLKLIYFDARGRAEMCRLAMAAAGIHFEDHRMKEGEWATMKSKMPFGTVPVLVVDHNEELAESRAILRYVCHLGGIAGKTPLEVAKVDMFTDAFINAREAMYPFIYMADEDKKAAVKKHYMEETLPQFMAHIEHLLKANHGGHGFLVGESLTMADIAAFNMMDEVVMIEPRAIDKHNTVKALYERVGELPKVKEWIDNRPQNSM